MPFTVRSIKRKMGTAERVTLGDRSYTPQEISALILGEIKRAAEDHLGEAVSDAVITRRIPFVTIEQVNRVKTFSRLVYHLSSLANRRRLRWRFFEAGTVVVSFNETYFPPELSREVWSV